MVWSAGGEWREGEHGGWHHATTWLGMVQITEVQGVPRPGFVCWVKEGASADQGLAGLGKNPLVKGMCGVGRLVSTKCLM
jgi:hypothetical protein